MYIFCIYFSSCAVYNAFLRRWTTLPGGVMRIFAVNYDYPRGTMFIFCNEIPLHRGGVEITACDYHSPGFLPTLKIFVLYFRGYVVLFRKLLYCWSTGNFGEQPFCHYSSKFFSWIQVSVQATGDLLDKFHRTWAKIIHRNQKPTVVKFAWMPWLVASFD